MRKVTFIILFFLAYGLSAQQVPQFSQYYESLYISNPAFTGAIKGTNGMVAYRKQWTGFGNEPTTFFAGVNTSFRHTKPQKHQPLALRTSHPEDFKFEQREAEEGKIKHGIGGYAMRDAYGGFSMNSVKLNYSAHVNITDDVELGIGTSAGINNMSYNRNDVLEVNNDRLYNDFVAANNAKTSLNMDFGASIITEQFFIGYASNQLMGDKITFGDENIDFLQYHHNAIIGYKYDLSSDLTIIPSTMLRFTKGVSPNFDFNARIEYNNFLFGAYYRMQDAVGAFLGYELNNLLQLSYSYDFNTSSIRKYSSGGHELVLVMKLKK